MFLQKGKMWITCLQLKCSISGVAMKVSGFGLATCCMVPQQCWALRLNSLARKNFHRKIHMWTARSISMLAQEIWWQHLIGNCWLERTLTGKFFMLFTMCFVIKWILTGKILGKAEAVPGVAVGFGAPRQVPFRGRCWHSHCHPGEPKVSPHAGLLFIGSQDSWLWPPISFHPGLKPIIGNYWEFLLPPCRNNGATPRESGNWFTRATKDNCLSFVSHLSWAAGCSYLYHARAPGMARECLMAGLVLSQDSSLFRWFSQGLSETSEIPEQAQG